MLRFLKQGVNGNEHDFSRDGREVTILGGLQRGVKFCAGITSRSGDELNTLTVLTFA
jgi:hypothetical protein